MRKFPELVRIRKKTFETVVVLILVVLPVISLPFNISSVQAHAGHTSGPEDRPPDDWPADVPYYPKPWAHGHNWIILNAIELLKKDEFLVESDVANTYFEDLMRGSAAADEGPGKYIQHYWDIGQWQEFDSDIDMRGFGAFPLIFDGKSAGGFNHFFDPWSHLGVGLSEDTENVMFLIDLVLWLLGLIPYAGWLIEVLGKSYADTYLLKWMEWDNWFGRNAATAAVNAFGRAVLAWNAGYQQKAMFYLGMVLHLISDVAAVPYHAANVLGSGHAGYESWVDQEIFNTFKYYEDNQTALHAGTIYNIDYESSRDHGIYLDNLKGLSDGIYFAGDPVQEHGHVYQLANPVEQFIDFAAHESVEWYPLVNDGKGWDHLEDWWTIFNYIYTRGDLTKNLDSRLIFHFEGVDEVKAEFQGQCWGKVNDEAIDMENNLYQDLGYVKAYNGYSNEPDHLAERGGPYVCEGWLFWGPEPSAQTPWDVSPLYKDATLQIQTVVDREGWWDHSCDGWQLWEVSFNDIRGPDERIHDPLLDQLSRSEKYFTTQGGEGYLSSVLLDDPLPFEQMDTARRIATVHCLDLAYKLCAGMTKLFFETVGLPTVLPETTLAFRSVSTYVDPTSGTIYCKPSGDYPLAQIRGVMARTRWDPESGKYDYGPEEGQYLWAIWHKKDWGDDQSWQRMDVAMAGIDPPNWWSWTVDVPLPSDENPHTLNYRGEAITLWNPAFPVMEDPINAQTIVVDKSPPETMIHVGEPSLETPWQWGPGGEFIPGELAVTRNTPIKITASDGSGSGVRETSYRILNLDTYQYVTGFGGEITFAYKVPVTLGGLQRYTVRLPGHIGDSMYGSIGRNVYGRELTFYYGSPFPSQPAGHYQIQAFSTDNLRQTPLYDTVLDVTLVDHLDGVDVKIDPYLQIIEPQSTATYNITVTNRYQTTKTYYLSLQGLDPSWFNLQTSITVSPETTENVTLTVTPPHRSLILKDYPFSVIASLNIGPMLPWELDPSEADADQATLKLTVKKPLSPSPDLGDISITAPGVIPVAAGASVQTSIHLESSDIINDNFVRLEINTDNIPKEERANATWFSWTGQYLFITPGFKSTKPTIDIPLTITIPPGSQVGQKFFDVQANSLQGYPNAHDEVRVRLSEDVEPPTTSLSIGSPKYIDASSHTYITSLTPLTLDAIDGDLGIGVASTAFRIYNATYDTGWITAEPLTPIQLTGLTDGTYVIEYNSTDKGGSIEPTKTIPVLLDNTGPTTSILNPPSGWALQDGVTFIISAIDAGSGVHSVNASIRVAEGGEGQPCGFEDLAATFDEATGKWIIFFETLQLPDGYYTILVETDDNLGNKGVPVVVPYSIRNWAVIELLPSSAKNKAGRTMPIKFSLRVAASVDPTQPFVYNEELTIKIYPTNDPSDVLQTSTYGSTARDYRIDQIAEKYITNFKTLRTPKHYTVSIYGNTFHIGSFTFQTTA